MASLPSYLKRTSTEAGITDASASKRRMGSPERAIRDASATLIKAVQKAENTYQQRLQDQQIAKDTSNSAGDVPKHVYIVVENYFSDDKWSFTEVHGTYLTLQDANYSVRNLCTIAAERDDPDANFNEDVDAKGFISWEYRDAKGNGSDVNITESKVEAAGSVPKEDWGRDIGEDCPSKESSDVDSDEYDRSKSPSWYRN